MMIPVQNVPSRCVACIILLLSTLTLCFVLVVSPYLRPAPKSIDLCSSSKPFPANLKALLRRCGSIKNSALPVVHEPPKSQLTELSQVLQRCSTLRERALPVVQNMTTCMTSIGVPMERLIDMLQKEMIEITGLVWTALMKPIDVLMMGGSVACGEGCSIPGMRISAQMCSYSGRFATLLQDIYGGEHITLRNYCDPGSTSVGAIPRLQAYQRDFVGPLPRLILFDYTVNDVFIEPDIVARSAEAFIRYVRKFSPETLIVFIQSYPLQASAIGADPAKIKALQTVAAHYRCPLLAYGPSLGNNCSLAKLAWGEKNRRQATHEGRYAVHPPWTTHGIIANALILVWFNAHSGVCDQLETVWKGQGSLDVFANQVKMNLSITMPSLLNEDEFGMCEKPLSVYEARAEFRTLWAGARQDDEIAEETQLNTSVSLAAGRLATTLEQPTTNQQKLARYGVDLVSGNWSLFEDRKGKPGWICETNGSIAFSLKVGAHPRLSFGYVQSYEGFGSATFSWALAANPNKTMFKKTVQGHSKQHVSQTTWQLWRLLALESKHAAAKPAGSGDPKASVGIVLTVVKEGSGKFKITNVMSC